MNRGRGTASIVASPVLVGAVTVLVVIVAVFLAYNANKGLPFVPTYDLSAQLPGGANLVPGNEVRIGGFRVGVVDNLRPARGVVDGKPANIAIVDMKLDKNIQPLAVDTQVVIRSRSALGLKYVQLTPGVSSRPFRAGDTIPLANSTAPVEFDDLLNTFNEPTRLNSQAALTGFGDALAGRGVDLNTAIEALNPFFRYLQPVAANLADPRTTLDQFFRQLGNTTGQIAPVAHVNAVLFTHMANTFAAISQCPTCLQDTIAQTPPTESTGIASFQVQQPFLADFTTLSIKLQPSARELVTALPPLNSALRIGTPVVRSSTALNNETKNVFNALNDLARDPNTLLALTDLRDTLSVTRPLVNFVAPYQTVCNYTNYFFQGLGTHLSEDTAQGTTERVLVKSDNSFQNNAYGKFPSARPADVPRNLNPLTATLNGQPITEGHLAPFLPAITPTGQADCQGGQYGYVTGNILPQGVKGRYGPANVNLTGNPAADQQALNNFEDTQAGGSQIQAAPYPMVAGTLFTGVPNLQSVDKSLGGK